MFSLQLVGCLFLAAVFYFIINSRNHKSRLGGKIPPGNSFVSRLIQIHEGKLIFFYWKLGPLTLPVIGNLLQMNFRNPFMTFPEMAEKYGDVCKFQLGNKT